MSESRLAGRVRGRGVKQHTFIGGEIAPELYARSDLARYKQSLRTCRNFQITTRGAAQNRPGTLFVREVKDSSAATRLIPFVFNVDQAYAIEFGDEYIRFHDDGGTIVAASGAHDGGTHATIMTDSGEAFVVDALIGMTIYNTTDGSSGVITDNDATTVTVSALTGGTDDEWKVDDVYDIPYEISTPYAAADLFRLKYAQVRDVVTIVHPDYAPHELKRLGSTAWTLAPLSVVSPVNPPTSITFDNAWSGLDGTHPVEAWDWVVVSVDTNGRRSIASDPYQTTVAVLYRDKTKPQFSWTAPAAGNTPDYYEVYRGRHGIYGFVGSTNTTSFHDSAETPDYFDTPPQARNPFEYETTLEDESAGGLRTVVAAADVAIKTLAAEAFDDMYTWHIDVSIPEADPPPADLEYVEFDVEQRPTGGGGWTTIETLRVYGRYSGTYARTITRTHEVAGAVADHEYQITNKTGNGTATLTKLTYTEVTGSPSSGVQPNYPAAVCFFEQRRVFARFTEDVQKIVASQTGDYSNFDRSQPTRDDDGLEFFPASVRLDEIRSIVPGPYGMYVFGAAAEQVLRGVEGGPLTPTSFDMKTQTHYGSSWVDALPVGNAILFPADRDRSLREFRFSARGGSDNDAREISLFASHLFEQSTIVEMAYADVPEPIIWIVRSDGALLGMTYVRDQDVFAFHRHDTGGLDSDGNLTDQFESVCTNPEGAETSVYVIVKRTVNSVTKRYVERLASRLPADPKDYVFLDSALQYDGTLSATVTATGGSTWAPNEEVTLTASVASFAIGNIHDEVWLFDAAGNRVRLHISAFTSSTVVTGRVIVVTAPDGSHLSSVPAALQGSAADSAHLAVDSFTGLGHLEAETLGVYADEAVQADVTVASGAIALAQPASRVCVGLRYDCDLETLQLEIPGDYGSARGARKIITGVGMEVDMWRGLEVGETLTDMEPVDTRHTSDEYEPTVPGNQLVYLYPKTSWDRSVRLSVRQPDPLPVTILSIIPEVEVGD